MAGQVPDIPGTKAPHNAAKDIMWYIGSLLGRKSGSFPGAQPISLVRQHLTEDLVKEDYFVCEKSDGLRCLLLLRGEQGEEKCYMITRKSEVYFIPDLHVPLHVEDFSSFHTEGTLIDGELVLTNTGKLHYLMFDMLVCNGASITQKILDKRLGFLRQYVYQPFQELCRNYPKETAIFPLTLKMKKMQFSYGLPLILKETLDHVSDGLIFTSRSAPYEFGTDRHILKWKPADENSVDFILKIKFTLFKDADGEEWYDYDSLPQTAELLSWHGGDDDRKYAELYLEEDDWAKLKALEEPLNDRVIECFMDDKQRWRYLRFRDDKEHGNHVKVVENVRQSISDHVTEEDLVEGVPLIRDSWHERAAQQKKKRSREDGENDAKRQHIG